MATCEDRIAATERALLAACREAGAWISGDLRVNEDAAAALIGVSAGTLRNWRTVGNGPPYFRHGRITYRIRDLAEYIESGFTDGN